MPGNTPRKTILWQSIGIWVTATIRRVDPQSFLLKHPSARFAGTNAKSPTLGDGCPDLSIVRSPWLKRIVWDRAWTTVDGGRLSAMESRHVGLSNFAGFSGPY